MPWNETNPVEERAKFVLAYRSGLYPPAGLCPRDGISRPTGYKWVDRYDAAGFGGIQDRGHAPQRCPHQPEEPLRDLLLECRLARPRRGPRTVLDFLRLRHPEMVLPAVSTVGDLFKREGLVQPRRRPAAHRGRSLDAREPNEVWTAAYKGEFRLGNARLCFPLTVGDAATRYLLACEVQPSTAGALARVVFERLFREHGLPGATRTDSGTPFASTGLGGLTQLSVWWIELGIVRERVRPGRPQENGAHERMHRTMADEVTRPPGADEAAQQQMQDRFRAEYNEERPHETLSGQTPASRYRASERAMPERTPPPEYAGHCEVRRVRGTGTIKFKGREIYLSTLLVDRRVALEEIDGGVWSLSFYDVLLARLYERDFRLYE